jgi:hypothetical protein
VKALTVDLPVCPTCLRVGKIPGTAYHGKQKCAGPQGNGHKITTMESRTFKEVR